MLSNYFADSLGSTMVCFLSGVTDCDTDVAMKHLIHNAKTAHLGVKFSLFPAIWSTAFGKQEKEHCCSPASAP